MINFVLSVFHVLEDLVFSTFIILLGVFFAVGWWAKRTWNQ